MKTPITLLIMALTMTIASCTKKGDTGPAGPQDAQGPAGPTGATGQPGNANVIAGIGTAHPSSWTWDANSFGNYVVFNVPDVTQDIVTSGMVAVFYSNGAGGWVAMPYTDYPTTSTSYTYDYVFGLGQVVIWLYVSDFSNTIPSSDMTFKMIVISAAQKQAHPHTDWNNYNEVMAIVNQTQATK